MNLQRGIYLLLFMLSLVSCSDEKKEQIAIESIQRLEQQSGMAQGLNRSYEERILDDYSSVRFEYFHKPMKYYVEKARDFDNVIALTINQNDINNLPLILNHYQAYA